MPANFKNRFNKPARCPRTLKIDLTSLFDSGKKIVDCYFFDRQSCLVVFDVCIESGYLFGGKG